MPVFSEDFSGLVTDDLQSSLEFVRSGSEGGCYVRLVDTACLGLDNRLRSLMQAVQHVWLVRKPVGGPKLHRRLPESGHPSREFTLPSSFERLGFAVAARRELAQ